MPSLLKGDSSRVKSSKLKPLDDKLSQSRLAEKQQHMEQNHPGNVFPFLFRWSGSTISPKNNNIKLKNQLAVPIDSKTHSKKLIKSDSNPSNLTILMVISANFSTMVAKLMMEHPKISKIMIAGKTI